MPKYKDKSDDCNFSEVTVSIGDIRKMIFSSQDEWALQAVCDKLEELENRISKIEKIIDKVIKAAT